MCLAARFSACCSALAKNLARALGDCTVDPLRPQAAPWQVVPVYVPRWATIGKADLVGTALGNSFVLDEADAHAGMIAPAGRKGKLKLADPVQRIDCCLQGAISNFPGRR